MTDKPVSALARPESCLADITADFPTCDRCGLAWDGRAPGPPCKAMTKGRMLKAIDREIDYLEQSHRATLSLGGSDDARTDPVPALQRAAEMRGIRRLVILCLNDQRILDILNPAARRAVNNG